MLLGLMYGQVGALLLSNYGTHFPSLGWNNVRSHLPETGCSRPKEQLLVVLSPSDISYTQRLV